MGYYSDLRNNDMRVEREIASWVDSHIYNKSFFQNVRRTDSLDFQYKGIDVVLDIPQYGLKDILIDEKSQGHYLLNPLPTFAFELSSLNKNDGLQKGWLIDETKMTQYYNLLWITASEDNKTFTSDKVIDCKFALISRKKILDYLYSEGWSIEKLQEKDFNIRQNNPQGGAIDKSYEKPYWFFYTPKLREKPVNIVFKRDKLFELSDFYYERN